MRSIIDDLRIAPSSCLHNTPARRQRLLDLKSHELPRRHLASLHSPLHRKHLRQISTTRRKIDGQLYDTFSDWHTQPRFPSCGQSKPNVAVLACSIFSLVGSSISAGFELCRWISIIIAHPQFCESVKCSVIGLSSSSHPSSALSHRKHLVLSGFVSWGS